ITAAHAKTRGCARIAIIDWDVHHGNGTQDIFGDRDDVLYCSIHQYGGIFPGTGAANERGSGAGTGTTRNIPLSAGAGGDTIVKAMRAQVLPLVRDFNPDLLLLSAGYDAHIDDPLGGLRATDRDFQQLMMITRQLAVETTGGRLISILEGGYHPPALARCVADAVEILDSPA